MIEQTKSGETATGGRVPLQAGLFAQGADGHHHLLASRCPACELTFFPTRQYCGRCGAEGQQQVNLGRRGEVHSFSVIDRKSKLTWVDAPYVQAEVLMPEGVHVFTILDRCEPARVSIGMPVEVYVDVVRRAEQGRDIETYKFQPADAAATR